MAKESEAILSPVPEFTSVGLEQGDLDKQLPEFDERDYSNHRNVYVGIHIPYSYHKQKKHHHGRHRKRLKQKGQKGGIMMEEVDQMPEPPKTPVDPCDRVKFILGELGEDLPDSCQRVCPEGKGRSHSIFTELEELRYDEHGHKVEWKETARWVKFEEDIEEGGEKWSKPHVATLSLHSLFDLRSCMKKGTVILDLDADNLTQISDIVVDRLVASRQLEEENREKVRKALLQRHKHHHTKDSEQRFISHIRSPFGDLVHHTSFNKRSESVDGSANGGGGTHSGGFLNWLGRQNSSSSNALGQRESNNSLPGLSYRHQPSVTSTNSSELSLPKAAANLNVPNLNMPRKGSDAGHVGKFDQHFMKKLPEGSEASNVLVGEVDFLSHTIIAFVRLSQGVMLGDLTEVPIPTRFLFILLGPKGGHTRYHEIGRAIATLMADEVFHDVAYKARNREDLLAGVDEFLDKVTVLPPGEWDPQIRLEPPKQVPSQVERRVNTKDLGKQQEEDVPAIECTKIPFQGLIRDAKRRYRYYLSDFRDAFWDTSLNRCSPLTLLSTIAAIIFIYFVNIAPAITFGQVLSDITEGKLGAVEMIMSVSIGNFIYSLTAGQPLVVMGGTGPTLVFEDILYRFCVSSGLPYLEFRAWIGMWTGIFLIVLVIFNVSVMMRIFTRFTEEIFSALISFIFIYGAFETVINLANDYPYSGYRFFPFNERDCFCYVFPDDESFFRFDVLNDTSALDMAVNIGSFWDLYTNDTACSGNLSAWVGADCADRSVQHDVFFFSLLMFFGTFLVTFYLKKFKQTPFFPAVVRRIISDYSVLISVIIWITINYFAHVEGMPTLIVPNVLQEGLFPNGSSRDSFLLNPLRDLPRWAPVAAIIPALLATILLFMDQQITALIVNRKDHMLKKGRGTYHLDMLIVGFLVIMFSFLGLPWVVGATVRSIAHVQSLFIFSPTTAPGEHPKFLGVREQRVTLLCMSIMMGLSVLMYVVLRLIPLPVLYGLFLYIGVASLYGVQFVERIFIIFMPDKYKPDKPYVRHIPNRRLHTYTLIQVAMLLVLCIFQAVEEISIIFPIMVLLLVVGRWLVGWCFPRRDLEILDDPIPEAFYCRKYCKPCAEDADDVESGKLVGSDHLGEEKDASMSSVTRKDHKGELEGLKAQSKINITEEVDRCDLWKHMVRSLDKEPSSPSIQKHMSSHQADSELKRRAVDDHKVEFSTKEQEALAEMQGGDSSPTSKSYQVTKV